MSVLLLCIWFLHIHRTIILLLTCKLRSTTLYSAIKDSENCIVAWGFCFFLLLIAVYMWCFMLENSSQFSLIQVARKTILRTNLNHEVTVGFFHKMVHAWTTLQLLLIIVKLKIQWSLPLHRSQRQQEIFNNNQITAAPQTKTKESMNWGYGKNIQVVSEV